MWIEQNVVPELLQMEEDAQIVDYLLLKFECLAIEQGEKDQDDGKNKRNDLFYQYFGLKDESLLERMLSSIQSFLSSSCALFLFCL
jgi:hypothetical protein